MTLGANSATVSVGDLLATGVAFQRNVDWDVAPTAFEENSFGNAITGNVVDSAYYGFESPNPLDAYGNSCAAGCNQTGDLGGGIKLGLADLAPGASESFVCLYGINLGSGDGPGQAVNGLITEAQGLGAYYWVATQSSENGSYPGLGSNSALIGVAAIPEPASFGFMALGLAGLFAYTRRRKNG